LKSITKRAKLMDWISIRCGIFRRSTGTCYLKNLDDWQKFNAVHATYFPENPPARATVEVARLPRDVLVEISFIAGQ